MHLVRVRDSSLSGCRQLAGVENLVTHDGLDLVGPKCLQCDGLAIGSYELDLVRLTAAIHEHHGSDVASDKTIGWKVVAKGGQIEFLQRCLVHEPSAGLDDEITAEDPTPR